MHIAILQIYCGTSGQFGSYNCQEVGLAKAMEALGHRCTVFYPAPDATEVSTQPLTAGVEAVFLPARHLSVHAFYDLTALLNRRVEAVILLADNHLFAPSVHHFCLRHGIPCANYVGAVDSDSARGSVRTVMGLLTKRNLFWFCHSPTFAKTPAVAARLRALGVARCTVAPVALDLSLIPDIAGDKAEVRRRLGLAGPEQLLLYVGRIDEYKRPLEMADVLAACPRARLVCIGDGALAPALEQRVDALGVRKRFVRIPRLPNAEVQPYYRAADAFLNFNDHEIFGMSILEAMYGACPVVARHAPGPDYIVQNGVTGFLVQDTAAYAAALERVTPAMGEAAHRDILDRFQWKTTARLMLDALEDTHGQP